MTRRALTIVADGRSHPGVVRSRNEDAFAIVDLTASGQLSCLDEPCEIGERGILLAVADGVGGECAGGVASAFAVEVLGRELAGRSGAHGMRDLDEAIGSVDRAVRRTAFESGQHGMSTTLTAVLVCGTEAFVACVGDSRAYLIRGRRIVQLTSDHNVAWALVRRGDLTPEEARRSPLRHRLLQALGGDVEVEAECRAVALCRGDTIIVCSDGLNGNLPDEELLACVAASPSLGEASAALVTLANERGGRDNITVVLARVDGDQLPEAETASDPRRSIRTIRAFDFASRRWTDVDPDYDEARDASPARRGTRWIAPGRRVVGRVAAAIVTLVHVVSDYFQ